MPVDVQYLNYEPLGFLSWGLREDGELVDQRAFGPETEATDIFALYTLDNEALRADFTAPWVIVGAIRPTSAMEIGSTGFCCGDAELVALARSPLWRDDEKRAAERTAQRYGVPLVEFDRLAAVASEHGSPVPEDDRLPPGPESEPRPRLRGGRRSPEDDQSPSGPTGEQDPLDSIDPTIRPATQDTASRVPRAAVAGRPSTPSPALPRSPSERHGTVAVRPSTRPGSDQPWRGSLSHVLAYCALGAALVALGAGSWLLARAGWPSGSLPFLLPATVAIALVSRHRLQVAVSAAIGGVLAALLYLLVTAGSGDTPEEAQVRFAMLVVAWFVTATAFACAIAAALSGVEPSRRELLAALLALVLPVGALVAAGLIHLPVGLGALLVAVVQLTALALWHQAINRRAEKASG